MHTGGAALRECGPRGKQSLIEFEVYYRQQKNTQLITYQIAIELDESGRPYVLQEIMKEDDWKKYKSSFFLLLKEGKGLAWEGKIGI